MKYALLLYGPPDDWANRTEEERAKDMEAHGAFSDLLRSRDAIRGGEELALPNTATTIRKNGSSVSTTDGPFTETREQLGGFYLVEAKDLDEALEFAHAVPEDIVEVRPIVEM